MSKQPTNFKRARSEDDKILRINSILSAAENAIVENRFEQCNMNSIAQEVGVSKTALYRYFRIKELIFLELYKRELHELIPQLEQAFEPPSAKKIAAAFAARPIFCKLSSILSTVLEQPLTKQEAVDFKQQVAIEIQPVIQSMVIKLGLPTESAINWILHLFAGLVGCWHIANPSELMRKAYRSKGLNVFKMEFASSLEKHVSMLLSDI